MLSEQATGAEVDQTQTLILGSIAGATILIGLPLGRLRSPSVHFRLLLNAVAIGILVFLIWDVLTHAYAPLSGSLDRLHRHAGGIGPVIGYSALFLGGIAIGLLSLAFYEQWLMGRGRPQNFPPGSMATSEVGASRIGIADWSASRRLALLIAVGIGLHNFGEGLAIGGSAAKGAIGLATVLVIGFSLHNATEGFGIVAPLAAGGEHPSWGFLLLMGVIGGAPTLVGTIIGRQFTSDAMSTLFLTVAAGSILYVVIQLLGVARKAGNPNLLYCGLLVGLCAGFITDMVVTAGGA